jgi:hypothetical protein
MSVDQVYIVDELKRKVKLLAGRLEAQRNDYLRLNNANVNLEDKIKAQEEEIKELKQQNNTLKLSKAFVAENNGSQEAKVQINKIVREIVKCIALLNR